ncbi:hypothetical protein [Cytobacillus purgationiresistens]|uniref:Uncharacterized protein n=1 Tax=Cytobacillus purgationiresistens TaxID=863449 RepID=A0ABU0AK78_9BACI|nr:hypothetical protein [Cytobacillus purgationiresistens]MDQ0271663.1 hypothetical protein [Cytobacillus purgationiresistens]
MKKACIKKGSFNFGCSGGVSSQVTSSAFPSAVIEYIFLFGLPA